MLCCVSTYLHMDTNDAQALPRKPNATVIVLDYRECTDNRAVDGTLQSNPVVVAFVCMDIFCKRERQTGRGVNEITLMW